jgi:hypothetical protein
MKKVIIILAMVFVPLTVFAGLNEISDNDMASITGQMGLSTVNVYMKEDLSLSAPSLGDKATNLSTAFFTASQSATYGVDNISLLNATPTLTPSATLSTDGTLYNQQIPVVIGKGGDEMFIMGQRTSVTPSRNPWPVIESTLSAYSNLSTMVNGMSMPR